MSRKIFISYNFNDRDPAHNVGVFFQPIGPCQGSPQFVPVVHSGLDAEIDRAIRQTLDGCVVALFVIGDNNHNSPWIDREAQLVESRNIPFAVVRLRGTRGGLPSAFRRRDVAILEWDGPTLASVLNRLGNA